MTKQEATQIAKAAYDLDNRKYALELAKQVHLSTKQARSSAEDHSMRIIDYARDFVKFLDGDI